MRLRSVVATTFVALSVVTASGTGSVSGGTAAEGRLAEPPNILVIVTDDQRAGETMDVMPRTLERFRAEGTEFPDAYVTTPICCPSRASIFSGLYAHNHRVRTNQAGSAYALDQTVTFQRYLQDAGYRTAMFGKYFNGWDIADDPPYFDRWALLARGYNKAKWNVNGRIGRIKEYSTTYLRRRALSFIRRQQEGGPWLLYLAPYAPHPPAQPEERFLDSPVPEFEPNPATLEGQSGDPAGRLDKPPAVQERATVTLEKAAAVHDKQLRSLLSVDRMVDAIFDALRDTGQASNTLAIYTSDNGYLWGEHGLDGKGVPYLPAVKVPLFLRWPGRVEAGAVDDRLAANIDIAPTLLSAAGVAPQHEFDGASLLEPSDRHRILVEGYGALSKPNLFFASTITRSYQYTEWYYDSTHLVPDFVEYYDLHSDPWQLNNAVFAPKTRNNPPYIGLHEQLATDKTCRGNACP